MERVIDVDGGQVIISEPFYSTRLSKEVREVCFTKDGSQGWGVSKSFPVDTNTFDSDFVSEIVECSKDML
mgnify:FL=1